MRGSKGKGKGKESKDVAASDVSYSRCALLQSNPHFAASNGSKAPKEPPSPGSLHCMAVDKLGEFTPARPRAASDSAGPAVRHKATTVILKNVPAEYSRTALCEEVATLGFGYAIDFLYLPIDSATGHNMGHAFINVRSKDAFRDFKRAFDGVPAELCLPGFESDKTCEICLAEVQGRDANMLKLVTPANLKKWKSNDDWQPLFLDDYGIKMPLEKWQATNGATNGHDKPRQRANSELTSAEFKHKASPVLKSQKSPQTKASPSMRAEAKEFSPSAFSLDEAEPTVLAFSLRAEAAAFSPPMRAEANEFVPTSMMLPEPAFVES